MKRLKELRENRAAETKVLQGISATLESENRAMTAEEIALVETTENTINGFDVEIRSLEKLDANNKRIAAIPVTLGMPDNEDKEIRKNFSMADVLKAGNGDNATGFLRELHEEGLKEMRANGLTAGNGVVIPAKALKSQARANQVAGTDNLGGYLVETTNAGGIIEYLGEKLVLREMGVQMFDFTGNVNFNQGTTGLTTTWEGEVDAAAETNETFAQISYTPNRLAGWTNISKQLIHQGNPSVSQYLNNEIQKAFARAWQAAAIHGNGSGIAGIVGTAGIGSVVGGTNGAAPTWAHLVNLLGQIADDNADEGALAYLTNSAVASKLQTTPRQASGVEGNFILANRGDMVNGLPMNITNSVSRTLTKGTASAVCSAIIAGNFAQLGMASFGGLEIFFDPYTQAKQGMNVMHVNGYVDSNVHNAKSFSAILDVLTS